MRTRSFEGGAHSPKDETTNWFDEFKTRMTKKSQANKQNVSNLLEESNNDDSLDSNEVGSVRFAANQPSFKQYKRNSNSDDHQHHHHSMKEFLCDSNLGNLSESGEDLLGLSTDTDVATATTADVDGETLTSSSSTKDVSSTDKNRSSTPKSDGSRSRKSVKQKISSVESPDFDTASINTIFNRRDSRYEMISRKSRYKLLLSKIINPIISLAAYLIPFNYNLPWKLLSLINFTFAILMIGLASESKPNVSAFSFFNGFICGLAIASFCFIILVVSLMIKVLPKSQQDGNSLKLNGTEIEDKSSRTFVDDINNQIIEGEISRNLDIIDDKDGSKLISDSKQQVDDFSTFEVLDSTGKVEPSEVVLLDDDDYKGWMIEFVGDYELRNKAEFKLKLIFVKLENRVLFLCKPKNSHDAESATFPVFVQQRSYNLETVTKFSANLLLPKNVHNKQKWVWSKKYPIKLEFQDDTLQSSSTTSGKQQPESSNKSVQLTLFAKSCREKEEWFRRFKRIVEENKLAQNQKRFSFQSENSGIASETTSLLGSSMKSFQCRSPSPIPRIDCIQTSRSSHVIQESKKLEDDKNSGFTDDTNLIRTKSCEILNNNTSQLGDNPDLNDKIDSSSNERFIDGSALDDSTLTKETAEIFSQAVEYSNFLESQPSLIYKDYIEKVIESGQDATSTSDWFNALTGRIFFDIFSHNYWSYWFKKKIQRKLYRIRLPYFMETLTLTTIDLGTNAPQFLNVVSHSFDSFGLSIDFDMTYSGGLTMTFETKLNLLKIKNDNSSANNTAAGDGGKLATSNQSTNATSNSNNNNATTLSLANESSAGKDNIDSASIDSFNKDGAINKSSMSSSGSTRTSGESSDSGESDSDSSSDSSSKEADVDEISDWEDYGAERTRQNIVRFVDKIASSRYFQHATENRFIKKKLQDISNCPLVLVVKIQSLSGVLTLNVPPPQTDRIWYGFKPNPELTLKALPKMGDREVNLSHVTDWIEKKLAEEFRKILVIPNMEDIVLPVLKSNHLSYVTTTR